MKVRNKSILNGSLHAEIGDFKPNLLLTRVEDPSIDDLELPPRSIFVHGSAHASAIVHELLHWTQFAGTSWGHLCLLCNQIRANDFANAALYDDLSKILSDISNLEIGDDCSWIGPIRHVPQRSALFAQTWRDNSIAYDLFVHGGASFEKANAVFSEESLGSVLTDVFTDKLSYYSREVDAHIMDLDDKHRVDRFSLLRGVRGKILGMKDLFEGQARANEVLFMLNSDQHEKADLRALLDHFIRADETESMTYWNFFHTYLQFRSIKIQDLEDFKRELARFCLIADIALSPEWPLCTELGKDSRIGPWSEFYPVNRFYTLLSKVGDFAKSFDWRSQNSHDEFVKHACSSAGWLTPNELATAFIEQAAASVSVFKNSWESSKFDSKSFFMRDYYFYIFYEFCRQRITSPSYIALPGLVYSNVVHSNVQYFGDGPEFLQSPLQMKANSRKVFTPLKNKSTQFAWLTGTLISNAIFSSCILQQIPLTPELFPFDVPERQQEQIAKNIQMALRIPIKWNQRSSWASALLSRLGD